MKTKTLIPLIAVGLTALSQAAFVVDNNAWTSLGDVGSISGVVTATNAVSAGTDDLINMNLSGAEPVSDVALEAFTLVDFFTEGYTVNEGSAVKQTFTVPAGETFSFNWQYLTNDTIGDFAFAAFDGNFILLADAAAAINGPAFGYSNSVSGFYTSGVYAVETEVTLSIGVADTDDFAVSSAISIPEPSTSGLICLAALAVGARRRRA